MDVRALTDAQRTILESIDANGPISAREAGQIVYRLRGYRNVGFVRRPWLTSAGLVALRRLEHSGLVRRTRGSRWTRVEGGCSDLIGPSVARALISTLKTPKASNVSSRRVAQARCAHAHDTPANRAFSGLLRPVTSSERSSAASRGVESYGSGRTEQLAPPLRIARCAGRDSLVRGVW